MRKDQKTQSINAWFALGRRSKENPEKNVIFATSGFKKNVRNYTSVNESPYF